MHKVLVNRSGGLSLPRKSVVRLTDHLDMTIDVYYGPKTATHNNTNQIVQKVLVVFLADQGIQKIDVRFLNRRQVKQHCLSWFKQ